MAGITYPGFYQQFLAVIDLFNLDLGWILQTGCLVDTNFHHRFIVTIVGPLVGLAIIRIAYDVARRKQSTAESPTTSESPQLDEVRQRYLSMVLLLTFVVYSSVSSTLFQMFACERLDDGNLYLRADYRIECDSTIHRSLQIFAGVMMPLYTAGIPAFYAYLLFRDREVLKNANLRRENARAKSISTLWDLYKPCRFWYELVECLRRVLLAGVVVFIYPNTVAQIAISLMVAAFFMVLCEALAPYESTQDTWVARLGHAIMFSSVYLALLLKVDVSDERLASQRVYGELLVGAHVVMVAIAVVGALVASCGWIRAGVLRIVPRWLF